MPRFMKLEAVQFVPSGSFTNAVEETELRALPET